MQVFGGGSPGCCGVALVLGTGGWRRAMQMDFNPTLACFVWFPPPLPFLADCPRLFPPRLLCSSRSTTWPTGSRYAPARKQSGSGLPTVNMRQTLQESMCHFVYCGMSSTRVLCLLPACGGVQLLSGLVGDGPLGWSCSRCSTPSRQRSWPAARWCWGAMAATSTRRPAR
jgi:hypothetical protein